VRLYPLRLAAHGFPDKDAHALLGRQRPTRFVEQGAQHAADVAVAYALQLAQHLGLAGQFPPAVAVYWARLQARPAFVRALQVQHQAALDQGVDPTPSPDLRPS